MVWYLINISYMQEERNRCCKQNDITLETNILCGLVQFVPVVRKRKAAVLVTTTVNGDSLVNYLFIAFILPKTNPFLLLTHGCTASCNISFTYTYKKFERKRRINSGWVGSIEGCISFFASMNKYRSPVR